MKSVTPWIIRANLLMVVVITLAMRCRVANVEPTLHGTMLLRKLAVKAQLPITGSKGEPLKASRLNDHLKRPVHNPRLKSGRHARIGSNRINFPSDWPRVKKCC